MAQSVISNIRGTGRRTGGQAGRSTYVAVIEGKEGLDGGLTAWSEAGQT